MPGLLSAVSITQVIDATLIVWRARPVRVLGSRAVCSGRFGGQSAYAWIERDRRPACGSSVATSAWVRRAGSRSFLTRVRGRIDLASLFVARHEHGTGLSLVLPRLWDHLFRQLWDHRRVVRRFGGGLLLVITSCRVTWRSLVAFREVRVIEIREVLRCWMADGGLRRAAERAGVDRKTARRYVEAAVAAGLVREGGESQLCDELIGAVVAAVRPARAGGHGQSWESLLAHEQQIRDWIDTDDLQLTNIHGKLTRRGVVVPYRTLHRFAAERCGFGRRRPTVRVADGQPGVECQIDFARMGLIADPDLGRRRVLHALIFTAVYSRHMFVWLTFTQTLAAVIEGCEAAWAYFGGVFSVLIPDNMSPIVADADPVNPTFTVGWLDYAPVSY